MASSFLQRLGELLRTQHDRATSYPMFIVQEKKRIWGMSADYSDEYEWHAEDDPEHVAEGVELAGLEALDRKHEETPGWEKVYYVDHWEFVTACFTEQGCVDYIASNGHNLNEPRICAASMYRNAEMIKLRDLLKSGGLKEAVDG